MYRLHQTPFEEIIENILSIATKQESGFTFPTVASVAIQKPDLLRKIIDSRSEIAVHGYHHVKYSMISEEKQFLDMKQAVAAYRKLNIPVRGFRAPYNSYGPATPTLIEKAGFEWDIGLGYSDENRKKNDFFTVESEGRRLSFLCAPLSELSDDLMIDELNYTTSEIARALKKALDEAAEKRGLIMFDLHPIRIGQPQYVSLLDEVIDYGRKLGGWFPTVSEAVEVRTKKGSWDDNTFCCLLTGDIDNFYFRDYLRRLS
jgi:peptidoglycan/xylan/chitin deacetylase (PgdA/CDA1 family)